MKKNVLSYIRSWFERDSGEGCVLSEVSHCRMSFSLEHLGCSRHALGPQVRSSPNTTTAEHAFSEHASEVSDRMKKLPRASLRKCWSLGSCPHGDGPLRCWKEEPRYHGSYPGCPGCVVRVRPSQRQTPGRTRQARDDGGLRP